MRHAVPTLRYKNALFEKFKLEENWALAAFSPFLSLDLTGGITLVPQQCHHQLKPH